MNFEKPEECPEDDVQDDSVYSDAKLKDICISTLSDEAIAGVQPRSPHERILERMLHPCYSNITSVHPKLSFLHEETLFYIFYMCPGDRRQENAFYILLDLGYFFCTTLRCFVSFTEKQAAEQLISGQAIVDDNKHKIIIFDPFCWEKLTKEVVYDADFIESLRYICK